MRKRWSRIPLIAVGVALVAMLALTLGSASASAATQHWYGVSEGPRLAEGTSTEVTGEGNATTLAFNIIGTKIEINCGSVKTSGTIENPAGGANGRLREATMTFKACSVGTPSGCTVPENIVTNQLQGETTLVGKQTAFKLAPETGTAFTTFTLGGTSCPSFLQGSKTLTGGPTAEFSGSGNQYETRALSPSTLKYGGQSVTLLDRFQLNSNSGQPVSIGADTEPAGQHWFVGGERTEPVKTKLAEGSTIHYVSVPSSTELEISATIGGANFRMQCAGSGGGAEGSVENPTGGGAGTATATITFAGCSVSQPAGGVCYVQNPAVSSLLSGLAGESAGTSSVTLSPSGKTTIATFVVGGESCPVVMKGSKSLTGSGLTGAPNASGMLLFQSSLNTGLKYAGQTATISAQTKPEISTGERLTLAP